MENEVLTAAEIAYRRGVHQALAMVERWVKESGISQSELETRIRTAAASASFYRHGNEELHGLLDRIERESK